MGSIPTPATFAKMEIRMSQESEPQFIIQRLSNMHTSDVSRVLQAVMSLEKETWPEEIQAPLEKFKSRAEVFPEGFLLISLPKKGLVGVSTSEIIKYDPQDSPISWEEITDNGLIKSTHNPDGNALYLVSVGASPKTSGMGVGTRLVKEQIELAKKLWLSYVVLGARIPAYAAYHKSHPDVLVDDYLKLKREDGQPLDPEIRFYTRCGLDVAKIVTNYMIEDPESENYGVVMVWKNPLVD